MLAAVVRFLVLTAVVRFLVFTAVVRCLILIAVVRLLVLTAVVRFLVLIAVVRFLVLIAVVRFLVLTAVVRFLVLIAVVRFLVLSALSVSIFAQAILAQAYRGFVLGRPWRSVRLPMEKPTTMAEMAAQCVHLENTTQNLRAPAANPSSPSPAGIAVKLEPIAVPIAAGAESWLPTLIAVAQQTAATAAVPFPRPPWRASHWDSDPRAALRGKAAPPTPPFRVPMPAPAFGEDLSLAEADALAEELRAEREMNWATDWTPTGPHRAEFEHKAFQPLPDSVQEDGSSAKAEPSAGGSSAASRQHWWEQLHADCVQSGYVPNPPPPLAVVEAAQDRLRRVQHPPFATPPTPPPSPYSHLEPQPQVVGSAELPHPVRDPVRVSDPWTQQVPEGGVDSWAPDGSWGSGAPQGSSSGAASSSGGGADAVPRSAHGWAQTEVDPRLRKLRPNGRYGERGGQNKKAFGKKFGSRGWATIRGEKPWCRYTKQPTNHRNDDQPPPPPPLA